MARGYLKSMFTDFTKHPLALAIQLAHAGSLCLTSAYLMFEVGAAHAAPEGGVVTAGEAELIPSVGHLDIHQQSQRAVIEYQDFSVAAGESVNFIQPNADAVTLNRVVGDNLSEIHGSITANGHIYLINPNGLLFGEGSQVDVNGLFATTLDVNDAEFMGGTSLRFEGDSSASILNQGIISASQAAVLVAEYVGNSGSVTSEGDVSIHSAQAVWVRPEGSGLAILVDSDVDNARNGRVENSGQVIGERVSMSAGGADSGELAIENTGLVRATHFTSEGGTIRLMGGAGDVINHGDIHAIGEDSVDAVGGAITIHAGRVGHLGSMDVSGENAGNGGSIDVTADEVIVLHNDSRISADGGDFADAGDVRVISPGSTQLRPNAYVSAQGGDVEGDGGFVELSGIEHVDIEGVVDVGAPNGEGGHFYIDPISIVVVGGGTDNTFSGGDPSDWGPGGATGSATIAPTAITTALQGGSVTIDTATGTGGAGTIQINDFIDINGAANGATLRFVSDSDFRMNSTGRVGDSDDSTPENINLVVVSGGQFNVNSGAYVDAGTNGTINMIFNANGQFAIDSGGYLQSRLGRIDITSVTDNVRITQVSSSYFGSGPAVSVTAGNSIIDAGDPTMYDIDLSAGATIIRLDAQNGIEDIETDGVVFEISNGASGNVIINEEGTIQFSEFDVASNATINAGGYVRFRSSALADTNGLNLNINAGGTIQLPDSGTLNVTGDMTIQAAGFENFESGVPEFSIAANTLTINSPFSAGDATFNPTVTTLNLTNSGANTVTLNDADTFTLGTLDASGATTVFATDPGNDYTVASNFDIDSMAGITFSAGGDLYVNADVSDQTGAVDNSTAIGLLAANNVFINDGVTVDAGTGTITVTATTGNASVTGLRAEGGGTRATITAGNQILDAGDTATDIAFPSLGRLVLNAQNGIVGIDTQINELDISNAVGGTVNVTDTNNIRLVDLNVAGDATLNSGTQFVFVDGGAFQADSLTVNATDFIRLSDVGLTFVGDLVLNAGLHIEEDTDGAIIGISATNLTINANSNGVDTLFNTSVDGLAINNASPDRFTVVDSDGFNITSFASPAGGDLVFRSSAAGDITFNTAIDLNGHIGNIDIDSAGDILVNADLLDVTAGIDNATNLSMLAENHITFTDGVTVDLGTGNVSLTTNTGDITFSGINTNNNNLDAATITAGNRILDAGDTWVDLDFEGSTGRAILTAQGNIDDIETHVGSLSLSSATGDVSINEDTNFQLVDLTAVNATLTAGDEFVMLPGSTVNVTDISIDAGDYIRLLDTGLNIPGRLSLTAATYLEEQTDGSAINLNATDLLIDTAASNGNLSISTVVDTLSVANRGGNDIAVSDLDDIDVTSFIANANGTLSIASGRDIHFNNNIELDGANGGVELNAARDILIAANLEDTIGIVDHSMSFDATAVNNITMSAGTRLDTGNNVILLTATGGSVSFNGLTTTNILDDAITIAANDQIIGLGDTINLDMQASGGALLTARNGISNINSQVNSIELNNTVTGDTVVSDVGDIVIRSVNVVDTLRVDAQNITMSQSGIFSWQDVDFTAVDTLQIIDNGLNAVNISVDAAHITNTSDSGLVGVAGNGFDITTSASNGDLFFAVDVASLSVVNTGLNTVTINESNSLNLVGLNTAGRIDVTTGAGSDLVVSAPLDLNAGVGSANLNSGNDIIVNADIGDFTGAIDHNTSLSLVASNAIAVVDGVTIDTGNAPLNLTSTSGDVTASGLQSNFSGGNAITIISGGNILDAGDSAAQDILSALGQIQLSATGNIDGLELQVARVDATSLSGGNILFSETDDLIVDSLQLDGDANIAAGGDLKFSVGAVGNVNNLTATAAAILIDDATLTARTNLILVATQDVSDGNQMGGDVSFIADTLSLSRGENTQVANYLTTVNNLSLVNSGLANVAVTNSTTLNLSHIESNNADAAVSASSGDINVVSDIELDSHNSRLTLNAANHLIVAGDIQDTVGAVDNASTIDLIAGQDIQFSQDTDLHAGLGEVNATAGGNIEFSRWTSLSSVDSAISLDAAGSIQRAAGNNLLVVNHLSAENGGVVLTANTGIGNNAAPVVANARTMTLRNDTSGDMYLSSERDAEISDIYSVNDFVWTQSVGNLTFIDNTQEILGSTSLSIPNGSLIVGDAGIVASDSVTLSATDFNHITGGSLSVSVTVADITLAAPSADKSFQTAVDTLVMDLQSPTSLTLVDDDALIISGLSVDGDASLTVNAGNLQLSDSAPAVTGALHLNAPTTGAVILPDSGLTHANVTINTGELSNVSNSAVIIGSDNLALSLDNNISALSLNLDVNSLNLSASGAGDVTIVDNDALSINRLSVVGDLSIRSAGNLTISDALAQFDGSQVSLQSGADIIVPDVGLTVSNGSLDILANRLRDSDSDVQLVADAVSIDLNAAGTSLGLDLTTAQADISLVDADTLRISNTSDLTLNTLSLNNVQQTHLNIGGILRIPNTGLLTQGDMIIIANDLVDDDRNIDVTAGDFGLSLLMPQGNSQLATQVDRLAVNMLNGHLDVIEADDIVIDGNNNINGGNTAVNIADGSFSLQSLTGDITVNGSVAAIDVSPDAQQAGRVSIEASNGDIFIGREDAVSMTSDATVEISDQNNINPGIVIRASEDNGRIVLGDTVLSTTGEADVRLSAIGSDIEIGRLVDGAGVGTVQQENDVYLTSYNSLTDSETGRVLINGEATMEVVAGRVALANRELRLNAANLFSTRDVPTDEIISDGDTQSATTEISQEIAQGEKSDAQFDALFGRCDEVDESGRSRCEVEGALKSFLSHWLVGGELPSRVEGR